MKEVKISIISFMFSAVNVQVSFENWKKGIREKHPYLIHYGLHKGLNGTIVNRTRHLIIEKRGIKIRHS